MQISSSNAVDLIASLYTPGQSGRLAGNANQSSAAPVSSSAASTSYDFSSMSRQQMVAAKDALVSSGQMSITQSLAMDGMIGFPIDGKSSGTSAEPAKDTMSVDWFKKLSDAVQTTIKDGGPTASSTAAVFRSMQNLFDGLQGTTATVNTVA